MVHPRKRPEGLHRADDGKAAEAEVRHGERSRRARDRYEEERREEVSAETPMRSGFQGSNGQENAHRDRAAGG